MSRTRAIVLASVILLGLALLAPARAQVMPSQGIDFSWFRSASDRAQRDACRRNLPECRAAVRAQMDFEESITVILPWAGLGVAILGVLIWLRAQEKKREQKKKMARMMHTPNSVRRLDKKKQADDQEQDEADRQSF